MAAPAAVSSYRQIGVRLHKSSIQKTAYLNNSLAVVSGLGVDNNIKLHLSLLHNALESYSNEVSYELIN